jgi:cell division protease FtsH
LLGGRVSEEIFFGDVTTGASSDIDSATRIARAMVTKLGMSALGPIQYEKDSEGVFLGRDYSSGVRNISGQVAYEIDSEVRKIIDDCHIKATELINQYKDTLILIAETLLTEETLTNEQITHLVNHGQLPPVVPVTPPEASDASSEVNNA